MSDVPGNSNERNDVANALKEKWRAGETSFGFWKILSETYSAEVAAGAGFDYVGVDQQHGMLGTADLLPLFQAVRAGGSTPLARVEKNDPTVIGRVLDWGASGVIVPLVNDAADARRAAEACRYPPDGGRSYGPVRAAEVVGSGEPGDLDDAVLCLVMIETREALENVEEISATPGIDGLYIGPADLGVGIGVAPTFDLTEREHLDAVERIRVACKEAGIIAGVHSEGAEQARKHAEAGFDVITVRSDHGLLTGGIPAELKTARG